ncbi:MAG: sulfatase-like hydrolase/transferase [Candidatus Lokiarchaeota archaeon]|nr:sulfatase-like hydrolase/transferase [Candidatus Lokiarchaeota archaeon]
MSERMNVLIIITDQQRADHLSCMGNTVLKTPNIDDIGNNGMRFTNYFCATPICMPNRANFFTGTYPSVHGTRSNGINLDPNIPTISEILRIQGFHTASIGKLHFNFYAPSYKKKVKSLENIQDWMLGKIKSPFPTPYYGFDEVVLTTGHGDVCSGTYIEWLEEKQYEKLDFLKNRMRAIFEYYYDTVLPEDLYPTAYITEKTVEFLKNYSEGDNKDKPFFLHCSYNDPHHPVCPPGKYKDLYKPEDIELPSNFNDGENLLTHEFLGQYLSSKYTHLMPQKVNEEVARTFIALTYDAIAMIDDGVGKILSTLEKTGMADNTMVIFTSDHGDYCGDHGLILKGPAHFRSVINMPLLWKVPGLTHTSVSNSLVSTVDLPKTILKLLRIKDRYHPELNQGRDITSILKNPKERVREQLLIEHDEELSEDMILRLRTLITQHHRLTLYDGYDNFGDLFNFESDPDEINNLWYKDKELRSNLVERLLREIISLRPRFPKREAYN